MAPATTDVIRAPYLLVTNSIAVSADRLVVPYRLPHSLQRAFTMMSVDPRPSCKSPILSRSYDLV